MTTVAQLRPGDYVTIDDTSATYITQTQHPMWPNLQLVIWRMGDGSWSHDALSPQQDVGEAVVSTEAVRLQRLRSLFLGTQWPGGV